MSTLKQKAEEILQEKEEKIIPENFSNELEIFGVVGNIPTISNINKMVSSILDLEENNQTRFMSDMENNTNIICEPNTSIFLDCSNSDLANVIGLTANKIKKDETILGITGTYEGSGAWNGIYLANNGYYYNTNIENLEIHTTDNKFNVKVERVLKCEDGMPDASMSLKVQVLDSQLYNKLLEDVTVSCDILDENRNLIYSIYSDNFNTLDYSKGNTWSNYVYISNVSGYFPLDGFDKARYLDNFAITYTIAN